jgi:hypothetical protein
MAKLGALQEDTENAEVDTFGIRSCKGNEESVDTDGVVDLDSLNNMNSTTQNYSRKPMDHVTLKDDHNHVCKQFPNGGRSKHENKNTSKAKWPIQDDDVIEHSIEELRQQMEELGGCPTQGNDDQSVEGIRQHMEKLGKFGNEKNSESTSETNDPSTEKPVDELARKLSNLGRFNAGINPRNNRTQKENNYSKVFNHIESSVEELCVNVAKMWKSESEADKHGNRTPGETDLHRSENIQGYSGKQYPEKATSENFKEENGNSSQEPGRKDQKQEFSSFAPPVMHTSANVFPSVVPTGKDDVFDFLTTEIVVFPLFLAYATNFLFNSTIIFFLSTNFKCFGK